MFHKLHKLLVFIFAIFAVVAISSLKVPEVSAQSCGSYTDCYPGWTCPGNPIDGYDCVRNTVCANTGCFIGGNGSCQWQNARLEGGDCTANTGGCTITPGIFAGGSCGGGGGGGGPQPPPPPGGGACGWCASNPQCSNAGGTATANSNCSNGFCCTGVGGGGGGGGAPPPPPPPKSCGEGCSNDSECRNPSPAGNPVACRNGRCENTACAPGFTAPGANCDCTVSNRSCGQTCGSSVGLCAPGSSCTFVNIGNTGNACIPGGTQTYCAGTLNGYSRPLCTAGDTGNSYLLGPGGKTTGFTADEILASCGGTPGSVRPIGVPNRLCGELCGYSGVAAYGITLIESLCATGVCRYVNESAAGYCPFSAAVSTYCVGTSNGYSNPTCNLGPDTGGAYLMGPGGQFNGLTQAQINASCGSLLPTPAPLPTPGVPVVDLRVNNLNGPITISSGTSVTLSWTVSGTTTLTASGGWSGSKTITSGTQVVGPLTANTTFTLTGTGPGGTRTDSVIVNVNSCTVSMANAELTVGETRILPATVVPSSGTVTQVNFVSSSPSVATVTSPDPNSPYATSAYGVSTGTSTVTVSVFMGAGAPACTTTATINVIMPAAWWQSGSGDVYAGGSVTSLIPASCLTPACEPFVLTQTGSGTTGVLTTGSGGNNFGSGGVSAPGWFTNTSYAGRAYDYAYFDALIPSTVKNDPNFNININSITNASTFNSAGVVFEGYRWIRRQGNLSIDYNANFNGNQKVVLFVEGDLTINGRINIQDKGRSFFATIVRNNIRVAGGVTNGANPALEGVYCVGSDFRTGASVNRLVIRGSIVGGNIALERDLLITNQNTPAERVDFAPENILLFPPHLSSHPVIWREVAP